MRRLIALGLVLWLAAACAAHAKTALKTRLVSESRLPSPYGQGVARARHGWVLSGTAVIVRTDSGLRTQTIQRSPIPKKLRLEGYRRVGDIDTDSQYIYAPLEQPNYNLGHQVTARYDVKTLEFIDSVRLPQHENAFVAVDTFRMMAYSMDRSSGNALLRYDILRGWKPLPPLVMDRSLVNARGGSIRAGAAWISTSNRSNEHYRVDLQTGHVDDLGSAGHVGGASAGIDATSLGGARIHVMTVGRTNKKRVWFGHFAVP